jgi:hypothetical protein
MRYRTKLVLLVSVLLAAATIVTSALLAWNTRKAILASAEQSLLARSAALASEIPREVEAMLGGQMLAEATILAHFVDVAEQANLSPEEISRRGPPDRRPDGARGSLGHGRKGPCLSSQYRCRFHLQSIG